MEEFVAEHTPLVRDIANRVRAELRLAIDAGDLMGYGFTGLLEARSRFDEARGIPFAAFAHYRVRGAILDGVRQMARLPHSVHRRLKEARGTSWALEELAAAQAAEPAEDLESLSAALYGFTKAVTAAFIACEIADEDPDHVPDDTAESPEDAALSQLERARLRRALASLPKREREVIHAIYFEGKSLDDISREKDIGKTTAFRVHARALDLLQSALR
ncbi:MAG: sigma-70 family RNA polymerase sigma factor [Kofleriaceae bacterium]|nr:sigma-70 family RNA polymerase sigma factor [Kofleriaceae bacterium]